MLSFVSSVTATSPPATSSHVSSMHFNIQSLVCRGNGITVHVNSNLYTVVQKHKRKRKVTP